MDRTASLILALWRATCTYLAAVPQKKTDWETRILLEVRKLQRYSEAELWGICEIQSRREDRDIGGSVTGWREIGKNLRNSIEKIKKKKKEECSKNSGRNIAE